MAGEFPKARQAFSEGSSSVPEWAFLRWVSQMLGVAGRQEGPVVIQARKACPARFVDACAAVAVVGSDPCLVGDSPLGGRSITPPHKHKN